jgi:hypothetical protein
MEALAANVVSPARGLLVWSPVVLLAVAGVVSAIRSRTISSLDVLLAAWVAAHLLAVSMLRDEWWAGWSVGPRFMADTIPALFFLMAPFATSLLRRDPTGNDRLRQLARVGFALTAAWSVFVNVRAAERPSVQLWNRDPVSVDVQTDRVWDWRDPQFLR